MTRRLAKEVADAWTALAEASGNVAATTVFAHRVRHGFAMVPSGHTERSDERCRARRLGPARFISRRIVIVGRRPEVAEDLIEGIRAALGEAG